MLGHGEITEKHLPQTQAWKVAVCSGEPTFHGPSSLTSRKEEVNVCIPRT